MVDNILWAAYAGVGTAYIDISYCGVDIYGAFVQKIQFRRVISGLAVYYMDVFCNIP